MDGKSSQHLYLTFVLDKIYRIYIYIYPYKIRYNIEEIKKLVVAYESVNRSDGAAAAATLVIWIFF